MKTFKVNKNINRQARIYGLSVNLFYLFLCSIIMAVFLQLGGITMFKLMVGAGAVLVTYIILRIFDSDLLDRLSNSGYPAIIINDNF